MIAAAPRAAMASWHVARVEGSVSGDAGDLLIGRDLVWQIGQDGRVAHVAGGEFGGPDFQRLLVNSYVYLAPYTAFGTAMLAGVPLPFTHDLDPPRRFARTGGAYRLDVDQEVERAQGPAIGDVHLQSFLAAAQRAEVRHGPVQVD